MQGLCQRQREAPLTADNRAWSSPALHSPCHPTHVLHPVSHTFTQCQHQQNDLPSDQQPSSIRANVPRAAQNHIPGLHQRWHLRWHLLLRKRCLFISQVVLVRKEALPRHHEAAHRHHCSSGTNSSNGEERAGRQKHGSATPVQGEDTASPGQERTLSSRHMKPQRAPVQGECEANFSLSRCCSCPVSLTLTPAS